MTVALEFLLSLLLCAPSLHGSPRSTQPSPICGMVQESLDDAKVSDRQQCTYECP